MMMMPFIVSKQPTRSSDNQSVCVCADTMPILFCFHDLSQAHTRFWRDDMREDETKMPFSVGAFLLLFMRVFDSRFIEIYSIRLVLLMRVIKLL
jgi:hypothetical protein